MVRYRVFGSVSSVAGGLDTEGSSSQVRILKGVALLSCGAGQSELRVADRVWLVHRGLLSFPQPSYLEALRSIVQKAGVLRIPEVWSAHDESLYGTVLQAVDAVGAGPLCAGACRLFERARGAFDVSANYSPSAELVRSIPLFCPPSGEAASEREVAEIMTSWDLSTDLGLEDRRLLCWATRDPERRMVLRLFWRLIDQAGSGVVAWWLEEHPEGSWSYRQHWVADEAGRVRTLREWALEAIELGLHHQPQVVASAFLNRVPEFLLYANEVYSTALEEIEEALSEVFPSEPETWFRRLASRFLKRKR